MFCLLPTANGLTSLCHICHQRRSRRALTFFAFSVHAITTAGNGKLRGYPLRRRRQQLAVPPRAAGTRARDSLPVLRHLHPTPLPHVWTCHTFGRVGDRDATTLARRFATRMNNAVRPYARFAACACSDRSMLPAWPCVAFLLAHACAVARHRHGLRRHTAAAAAFLTSTTSFPAYRSIRHGRNATTLFTCLRARHRTLPHTATAGFCLTEHAVPWFAHTATALLPRPLAEQRRRACHRYRLPCHPATCPLPPTPHCNTGIFVCMQRG